jgi:hypothetical protein
VAECGTSRGRDDVVWAAMPGRFASFVTYPKDLMVRVGLSGRVMFRLPPQNERHAEAFGCYARRAPAALARLTRGRVRG